MPARAIWKGVVTFEDVRVPVKLYSAVEDRRVHFNLLHDQDMTPIKQKMTEPLSDKDVELSAARRGVEIDPGRFVLISDEEIAALQPPESRDIRIEKFVPVGQVTHPWYDRPYYLGPDEDDRLYWVLAQALEAEGKEGIARWSMRRRDYVGTLGLHKNYLMLITARRLDEVVPASELALPAGRKLDAREVRMAQQLVEALEDKFDPSNFRDEYRDRVMALIERKAKGERIELIRPEAKPATGSLTDALEASLKAAKREKSHAR